MKIFIMIKELINKKYVIVLFSIFVLAYLLLSLMTTFFSIKYRQYIDPQPNFLLTFIENTELNTLTVRIEADVMSGCAKQYEIKALTKDIEEGKWIKLDGLYKIKTIGILGCRPRGRFRPSITIDLGTIEQNQINIIFTLGDRINKYTAISDRDILKIQPTEGGFTQVISYGKLGVKDEFYSAKYNRKFNETIEFMGDQYYVY